MTQFDKGQQRDLNSSATGPVFRCFTLDGESTESEFFSNKWSSLCFISKPVQRLVTGYLNWLKSLWLFKSWSLLHRYSTAKFHDSPNMYIYNIAAIVLPFVLRLAVAVPMPYAEYELVRRVNDWPSGTIIVVKPQNLEEDCRINDTAADKPRPMIVHQDTEKRVDYVAKVSTNPPTAFAADWSSEDISVLVPRLQLSGKIYIKKWCKIENYDGIKVGSSGLVATQEEMEKIGEQIH